MEDDLRRQSDQRWLLQQTREEMQERYDLWGNRDETSMFKEVGDSAETEYDHDMYVASEMASRWKEIHWLYIDARCWKATYGPNTRGWAHLHESKDADGNLEPQFNEKANIEPKFYQKANIESCLGQDTLVAKSFVEF